MAAQKKELSEVKVVDKVSSDNSVKLQGKDGKTFISAEAIADIAGLAIREVEGVHELVPFGAGQTITALAHRITGAEQRDRGVHVEVGEIEAAVDCRIVVDYGASIPSIADKIRASLKKRIKSMTGLETKEVNIEVVDLYFADAPAPEAPRPLEPRVR